MLSNSIFGLLHARCVVLAVVAATVCGHALGAPTAENIRQALQAGQLELAARLVQQERQVSPRDVQMRFLEGVVLAQQGQTDKAIESFSKLVASNPEIVEAHNNLGVLLASKGRLEDARKALEAGMHAHASYATLHRNLDDVQSQLTRQTYAKALQVDSKSRLTVPQLSLLGSMGAPLPALATTALTAPSPAASLPASPSAAATPPVAASAPPAQALASKATPSRPETTPTPPPPATRPAAAPTASPPAPPPAPAPAPAPLASSAPASKADAGKAEARATQAPPPDRADTAEVDAIRHAVQAWAKAWSSKDMVHYLEAYASSFVPPEHQPRSKWEADRRQRILSKKSISVELRQLKISANGQTGTAQFQQIYTSDNFTGNSRKTLEMVKQGKRWLIVRETVN